jgi:hypothetical protein
MASPPNFLSYLNKASLPDHFLCRHSVRQELGSQERQTNLNKLKRQSQEIEMGDEKYRLVRLRINSDGIKISVTSWIFNLNLKSSQVIKFFATGLTLCKMSLDVPIGTLCQSFTGYTL